MAERSLPAPSKLRKLSVVVPVFNERNTLVEVLTSMPSFWATAARAPLKQAA